jgi:hypothetical protein
MGSVTSISAGSHHNVALKSDGAVWVWGRGSLGQIGDNNTVDALTPRQATISNVVEIRANDAYHTLARTKDGSVFAWGWNPYGAIGNGTSTNQLTPLNISLPQGTGGNLGNGVGIIGVGVYNSFAAIPQISVPTGSNVRVEGDNVRLTFANVTTAGDLQIRAIDPSATGLTVPAGYSIQTNSQGYDFISSAQFTGAASVCVKVSTVLDATTFNRLYILHDDDGDGTLDAAAMTRDYQKREICRSTTSFSPFVIAEAVSPTASSVSISGRVITPQDLGLTNALVTLTDMQGNSRAVLTGRFGSFQFTNVTAGETYILSITSKRYTYSPQVITVTEDLTGLSFAPQ